MQWHDSAPTLQLPKLLDGDEHVERFNGMVEGCMVLAVTDGWLGHIQSLGVEWSSIDDLFAGVIRLIGEDPERYRRLVGGGLAVRSDTSVEYFAARWKDSLSDEARDRIRSRKAADFVEYLKAAIKGEV